MDKLNISNNECSLYHLKIFKESFFANFKSKNLLNKHYCYKCEIEFLFQIKIALHYG